MLTPWMHSLSHSVSSLSVGVYQDSRTRLAARRDVYRIMMKEAKPVDTLMPMQPGAMLFSQAFVVCRFDASVCAPYS